MSAPTPEFLALQQAVAGRYSLDRELGRGGMGVVFLARDVALDRPVAIKLLPPALAAEPEGRARFLREARTAARLSHPHIVPIHAVEERDGLVYFVMAFVDGETLGERVRRSGPLAVSEVARVTQEVAWALGHAHAHGVVHRDVKPDNVLLERASGRALVTDFGIAHAAAAGLTPPDGTAAGTPAYMSPEQAAGGPADARADLYSLGVTAFYAATGRLPFQAPTAVAMLVQHATVSPPPLLAARPSLPPDLARAVDRCLAKDPDARWASADELAEALRGARAGMPELPPPVRGWLREVDAAGGEIGTALTASGVSIGLYLSTDVFVHDGLFGSLLAGVAYLSTAALTAGLAKVRLAQLVARTRPLVRRGYGHDAVRRALALDERARREEERAEGGEEAQRRAGPSAATALAAAAGTAGSALALWAVGTPNLGMVIDFAALAASIAVPTVTIRRVWDDLRGGRRAWHRMLEGRAGRLIFRLAGVGQPAPALAPPAAGEPTAIAVGRAADALFAALPAAQRTGLGDVPALLARLEADALAARAAGPDATPRLQSAVAALEAIRLDLLRLHAGAGTLDELTRDVEAARELGRRVDAELAARDELRRARHGELTPA
jgi:serine/threonine-protein kinase